MKHPASYATPRRLAQPKKRVRLDLRPGPGREPEDESTVTERKSSFWRWVLLVALLHLVAITIFYFIYQSTSSKPPPEPFISLLPPGDTVKGTPGVQQAPKVGLSTPAPSVKHRTQPPAPASLQPEAVQPPAPAPVSKPLPTPPPVKSSLAPLVPVKPASKPKPTPPKVKVDLSHLVDREATPTDKPAVKPKPHHAKPVSHEDKDPDTTVDSTPDNSGLSKEQIAQQLGQKISATGAENALTHGVSGSAQGHAHSFADFYASIRDQAYSKWHSPDMTEETDQYPVVTIHVEKDGHVPPEQVVLTRSSGNTAYDDSAVAAAKSLGYLYQPLPDGCSPDISINFKLTR